jgi:hypothetical protein
MRITSTRPATSTAPTRPRAGGGRARRLGGRRAIVLAGLLALLLALAGGSSAHAGSINVWACQKPNGQPAPLDRWASATFWAGIDLTNTCASSGGYFGVNVWSGSHPQHSYGKWTFTAPAGTTVTAYSEFIAWQVNGWASFQSFRGVDPFWTSAALMDLCQSANGCHTLAGQNRAFGVDHAAGVLLMLEACGPAGSDCDASSNGWAALSHATVTLEDSDPPTFSSLAGGLTAPTPLRGNASMTLQAADVGTGVYKLHATVDGRSFDDRIVDTNGGKCQPVASERDFVYAVPCRTTTSVNTTLNTATLPDGTHTVDVKLEDASGNVNTAFHDDVTTHNAPVMSTRPAIAGAVKLGQELSATPGTWSSPSTSTYAYQWLRCPTTATLPSDADGCAEIAGATRSTYLPVTADAYRKLMVRVTATNASGSTSAYSAPSDLVADAQGRTSPPPTDDGGSRDVVIVPIPPGPGSSSSSSSTTIINPPAGSTTIEGLKNPIAGPGHVPNGTNASEGGRAHVAFEIRVRGKRRSVATVSSTRNRRWVIKGRLVNASGEAISGGQLVTAWQINGRWSAHTGVRTRPDGRFTYILPKGPTRAVKFVYFAFSDSKTWSESNTLVERVSTPVKLRVSPRAASNGRSVKFTGTVGTDFLAKDGVLVTLQARYPGGTWKQFATARTSARGRFSATYRFTHTSSTTRYAFRARVAKQTGYPFEGGISQAVGVLVTP